MESAVCSKDKRAPRPKRAPAAPLKRRGTARAPGYTSRPHLHIDRGLERGAVLPQRFLIGCRLYQRRGAVDRQLYCQFTARFVRRGRSLTTRPVAGGLVGGHGGVAPERALHGRQCRRRREVRSRRVTARRAAGQGPGRRKRGEGGAGGPTRHGGHQRRAAAPSAVPVAGGGGWRARPSSAPPRPRLKVSALCSRRLWARGGSLRGTRPPRRGGPGCASS